MDCSHCTMSSRLFDTQDFPQSHTIPSSDDDGSPTPHRRTSSVNVSGQLNTDVHNPRNVQRTVSHQLSIAKHDYNSYLDPSTAAYLRRKRLLHSAHSYPPAMASFTGLGLPRFILYCLISFDKLHLVDLGVTRQYCDLVNTVIREHTTRFVSRSMVILNDRIFPLPSSAWIPSRASFRTSAQDTQAGISGNIRHQCAPFLWCCVMGVSFHTPDADPLLQTALQLDSVNIFICNCAHLTADDI